MSNYLSFNELENNVLSDAPIVEQQELPMFDVQSLSDPTVINEALAEKLTDETDKLDDDGQFHFGPNDEDLPWISVIQTEDKEVEFTRTVFVGLVPGEMGEPVPVYEDIVDDSSDINAYFTTTGDNPVLECAAKLADLEDRNLTEPHLLPTPAFYSACRTTGKVQHRNFMKWMLAIRQNSTNQIWLRQAWNKFWRAVYRHQKAGDKFNWMFNKQISSVKAAFERLGIKSQKQVQK